MSKIDKTKFRRQIQTDKPFVPSIRVVPAISKVFEDARCVIEKQVELYLSEGALAKMEPAEVRAFVALVEAATKLSREEREQAKAFEPGQLDDEELLAYAQKAAKLLGDGQSEDSKEDREAPEESREDSGDFREK